MTSAQLEHGNIVQARNGCHHRRYSSSYLTLDVYFAERSGTQLFKMRRSFTDLHPVLLAGFFVELLLDHILGAMRLEEFTTYCIVVEAELISQEAQSDTNITVVCQRLYAQ